MKRGVKRRHVCAEYKLLHEEPLHKRQHVNTTGNTEIENALVAWCNEMKRFAVTLDIRMEKSITIVEYHRSIFPGIILQTKHIADDCIYAKYVLNRKIVIVSTGTTCNITNGSPRPSHCCMLTARATEDYSDSKFSRDCEQAFMTYIRSTSPYCLRDYIVEIERVYEDLEARVFDTYATEVHNATGLPNDLIYIILEM
jgi:hypothetical protein